MISTGALLYPVFCNRQESLRNRKLKAPWVAEYLDRGKLRHSSSMPALMQYGVPSLSFYAPILFLQMMDLP